MNDVVVPEFGALLAPFIGQVPEQALPNFLALLERGAAQRYRDWAEQLEVHRAELLECAASEDKIADIVEGIFPIDPSLAEEIKAPLPAAKEAYYAVFEELEIADQLAVQAAAELQGAEAWRAMISDDITDEVRAGLEQCIALEEASSAYLYSIIEPVRAAAEWGRTRPPGW